MKKQNVSYIVKFENMMIKIAYEKRLLYRASAIDDGYIVLGVEHDNLFDQVCIDFLSETVHMHIYDKYGFIIRTNFKCTLEYFLKAIEDMNQYEKTIYQYVMGG